MLTKDSSGLLTGLWAGSSKSSSQEKSLPVEADVLTLATAAVSFALGWFTAYLSASGDDPPENKLSPNTKIPAVTATTMSAGTSNEEFTVFLSILNLKGGADGAIPFPLHTSKVGHYLNNTDEKL